MENLPCCFRISISRITSSGEARHTPFQTRESEFDFILPGPVGRERFKLIAVRKRSASQTLKTAMENIPREDRSPFQSQAEIVPRDTAETRILKELLKLNPADWAEASTTIILRDQ